VNQDTLRIGIGHDTHRLKPGGPLRIGGIDIEHSHSLEGHSDADVLLHAVTDAILGAAAMGDIGELFPDTDPQNRMKDSGEMLKAAFSKVVSAGFQINNLDCIIFAQKPKMSPVKREIAKRIAELLEIDADQEVIMAECIVLLRKTE
jgi:2-C-methyl-D-erythritol 2,4-cyclodiphosphate synthase